MCTVALQRTILREGQAEVRNGEEGCVFAYRMCVCVCGAAGEFWWFKRQIPCGELVMCAIIIIPNLLFLLSLSLSLSKSPSHKHPPSAHSPSQHLPQSYVNFWVWFVSDIKKSSSGKAAKTEDNDVKITQKDQPVCQLCCSALLTLVIQYILYGASDPAA